MESMRIGVIGTGNIGGTLARKWAAAGHELVVAGRETGSPRSVALQKELGDRARLGSAQDAASFGDVVVFAIPGAAMAETVRQLGGALQGKVIIDATNNVRNPVMNSVESITKAVPDGRVFRAFNTLPWEAFANPTFGDTVADLFYCGPQDGRDAVERLIKDVGLQPVYVGDLQWLSVVDPIAGLFFALSQARGRRLAFKLLMD
jgi:predicted dinucleotide-binding enzyme